MTRLNLLTIWLLAGAAVWAQTSVSANGWTVAADSQNRIVSIAYEGLGPGGDPGEGGESHAQLHCAAKRLDWEVSFSAS